MAFRQLYILSTILNQTFSLISLSNCSFLNSCLVEMLKSWIAKFPDGIYTTNSKVIFCQPCQQKVVVFIEIKLIWNVKVQCSKLFQLTQHNNTQKHQENLERYKNRGKQRFLEASTSGNLEEKDPFVQDLCDAFISANIPFNKIENNSLRYFLEKYTNRSIPSRFTMHTNLEVCFRAVN